MRKGLHVIRALLPEFCEQAELERHAALRVLGDLEWNCLDVGDGAVLRAIGILIYGGTIPGRTPLWLTERTAKLRDPHHILRMHGLSSRP